MTIRGLEGVGQIRRVEITKRAGRHSICRVEIGSVSEGYALWIGNRIGAAVTVENEEQIVMRGIVKDIAGCVTYLGTRLTVTVISLSSNADKTPEDRIFQSPDKTWRQVMERLSSETMVIQILDQEFAYKTEPGVLIQSSETDFEFISRIAEENGYRVFVDDTNRRQIRIHIAKSMPGMVRDILHSEIKSSEFAVREEETVLKLRLDSLLDLGEPVRVDGFEYVVMGYRLIEENDTVSYDYELCRRSVPADGSLKSRGLTRLMTGIVVSSEDPEHMGRIQVAFQDMEDCITGELLWIPYAGNFTEKDEGVFLFPDRGECVGIICQGGECMALGCVRRMPAGDDCRDTADRVISLRGKKVVMNQEKIELEAFRQNILMTENKTALRNEKFAIEMKGDLLQVACGTTRINLNEEVIQLLANSRIDVKAGHINMDGSEKVSVKTAAFDVG